MKIQLGIAVVAVLALGAGAAVDAGVVGGEPSAQAELKDAQGKSLGVVRIEQTSNGLLLKGTLSGVSPGSHGLHVHEVGKCEAPFKTAGGHFNPSAKVHGMRADGGLHAGDLPNVVVPADGKVAFELFAPGLTLTPGPQSVLDADGSSLVLHAKADDYLSQPAGNSGDRQACGVVVKH